MKRLWHWATVATALTACASVLFISGVNKCATAFGTQRTVRNRPKLNLTLSSGRLPRHRATVAEFGLQLRVLGASCFPLKA
jgi:hypothetical protein